MFTLVYPSIGCSTGFLVAKFNGIDDEAIASDASQLLLLLVHVVN